MPLSINEKKGPGKKGEEEVIEEREIDYKLIVSTFIAVLSTLVLLYVIYTMVFKKETVVIEEYIIPELNIQEDIEVYETKRILQTGEIEDIERSLQEDEVIRTLKIYSDYDIDVGKVGNSNPFEPFDQIWSSSIPISAVSEQDAEEEERPEPETKIPVIAPSN